MINPDKERNNYNKHIKTLSQVTEQTLKKLGLYQGYIEFKINKEWKNIAGQHAKEYTAEIKIINNKLYIKVLSSVLRNELNMNKEHILKQIYELLSIKLDDIIFY